MGQKSNSAQINLKIDENLNTKKKTHADPVMQHPKWNLKPLEKSKGFKTLKKKQVPYVEKKTIKNELYANATAHPPRYIWGIGQKYMAPFACFNQSIGK